LSDTHRSSPAIGLWEFNSIADGVWIADAIAKHAPVMTITTGTTQPGHYLILAAGDTASVDVAVDVVADLAPSSLLDHIYLSDVDSQVADAITSGRDVVTIGAEAVGVIETTTVAAAIGAADAAVKEAEVGLGVLRLADGLGGRAFFIVDGLVGDVDSSVAAAVESAGDRLAGHRVISNLTDEVRADLASSSAFGSTIVEPSSATKVPEQ